MATMTISALHHTLDASKNVSWTTTQEKTICREFPFDLHEETADQYTVRTYLQFLWLPESIMPLHLLIPCLRRVNAPSSSTSPHPLHALLEPLLLTVRAAANKYHVELPRILSDGGGAGEIEETMMWFALNYEKVDEDALARSQSDDPAEGPWADEKWRHGWLERMERREIQIQILLYFLKLSLPGPLPAPTPPSPVKRKRSSRKKPVVPELSAEEHLESFMDKLSMWQLMRGLVPVASKTTVKNGLVENRDWIQIFTEEVVEPQFKSQLPDPCALLRTKVFPSSPFSDDSSRSSTRSPSPEPPSKKRSRSSASNVSSNALPTTSRQSEARSLARSRSRSLSVSLAQEREKERAGSAVSTGATKKRVLNREISMSRVFKAKSKPAESSADAAERSKAKEKAKEAKVEAEQRKQKIREEGVTLVAATPAKATRTISRSQSMSLGADGLAAGEEDIWDLPNSPGIMMLLDGPGGLSDSDADLLMNGTPSKRARKRAL